MTQRGGNGRHALTRALRQAIEASLLPGDIPMDADPNLVAGQLVLYLRSDWEVGGTTYPQGSLIATDYEAFLGGTRDLTVVFQPSDNGQPVPMFAKAR